MGEDAKKSSPVAAAAGKSSDNYNGSSTDKYSWSQTIKDLDVKIPVSKSILKGKDLIVTIKTDSLQVRLAAQADAPPLVAGEFTFPVDKEESCWNLVPGETITIFLEKAKERWWTALLKDEETIDPASIEAEIPMEELGEEEQMKIQELMWKEEQKKKGLSSKDKDIEAILKKAWDKDGSPFKGMPYDPSAVKVGSDPIPPEILEAARASSNESH